jgi:major membrane immunogen (membrane-anchored lipoprotein)
MIRKLYLVSVILLLAIVIAGCSKTKKDSGETTAMEEDPEVTVSAEPTEVPTAAPAAATTAAPTEAPAAAAEGAAIYRDGVYEIEIAPDYESYYTKAALTIEGGKITAFDWTIYDKGHNDVPFDEEYYKVMEPYSALYVQQSKDDWTGSRGYTDALIETQDVTKVDAVSGATWTNRKFKEAVKAALKEALAPAAEETPADSSGAAIPFKGAAYSVHTEPDNETYFVEGGIIVEGGKVTSADWFIYDEGRDNHNSRRR